MIELIFVAIFLTLVCGTLGIFTACGYLVIGALMIVALTLMVTGAVLMTFGKYTKAVVRATEKECRKQQVMDVRNTHIPRREGAPPPVINIAVVADGGKSNKSPDQD